jgi:hypothetical protein
VYIWHGQGALPTERQAARAYAKGLGSDLVEMTQGEDDNDEMFWMAFGSDEFAKANYWKWRQVTDDPNPRIWAIDSRAQNKVCYLETSNVL